MTLRKYLILGHYLCALGQRFTFNLAKWSCKLSLYFLPTGHKFQVCFRQQCLLVGFGAQQQKHKHAKLLCFNVAKRLLIMTQEKN